MEKHSFLESSNQWFLKLEKQDTKMVTAIDAMEKMISDSKKQFFDMKLSFHKSTMNYVKESKEQVVEMKRLKRVLKLNVKKCLKKKNMNNDLKLSGGNLRNMPTTQNLPERNDLTEITEQVMKPEELKRVLELNVKEGLKKETKKKNLRDPAKMLLESNDLTDGQFEKLLINQLESAERKPGVKSTLLHYKKSKQRIITPDKSCSYVDILDQNALNSTQVCVT